MHYAVPRILQESGQLERFYTDICATHGWPRLLNLIPSSARPAKVNRLLSRVPGGVHPRAAAHGAVGFQAGDCRCASRQVL